MKIEFLNSSSDGFLWWLLVLWGFVWLGVLYRVLTRTDFDTLHKILWVIVVIFVPFFGVALYWMAAPSPAGDPKARIIPGSDVSGTPWADNPNHTGDK